MITQRIDQLSYSDIERLVEQRVPEGRLLDYKRQLPSGNSADIKELLADVTSFANASGGHLIYGITTKKIEGQNTDIPDQILGLGSINIEQETLRLDNLLRTSIQPRIIGIRVKAITAKAKPPVIVILIPQSLNAPHIIANGSHKFFSRTSAGKYPLDITEIRHAFAMSDTVGARIRAFRDERIGRILAGETPSHIESGSLIVIHCIPLDAFTQNKARDIDKLATASSNLSLLPPARIFSTNTRRVNLDGLLISAVSNQVKSSSYVQVFCNQAIETVDGILFKKMIERYRQDFIFPILIEESLIKHCDQMRITLQNAEVSCPMIVFISFLNVRGFRIQSENMFDSGLEPIDRDHLLLPDLLVEDLNIPAETFLKPALDLIWQACGGKGSIYYDKSGKWVGQQ